MKKSKAVQGFLFSGIASGIKKNGKKDLGLIYSKVPAKIAAVFTRNRFAAAPVLWGREVARAGFCRAILVNSGNANACTGERGVRDAKEMAALAARALGLKPKQVLVSSTGVIGEPLRISAIREGVPKGVEHLSPFGAHTFADAIMTTDIVRKVVYESIPLGKTPVRLLGVAKGAGMIMPNMATMLAYLVTDAAISLPWMRAIFRKGIDLSFNAITIDGDTSTNDTAVLLANGQAHNRILTSGSRDARKFEQALYSVMRELARMIVKDAEGGTKIVKVCVQGAPSISAAREVAYRISNSLLVKTALYGEDLNWGRIVAAAGATGVPLDPNKVDIKISGVPVLKNGRPLGFAKEKVAARRLRRHEIDLVMDLKMGRSNAEVLTSDLTEEYIRINSAYRS
ncbi:MAG: bifunctional glutamate N-acetyltransferase/amino-acid acetyltransferase ArgJ [Deltaproteobacteria bacterium]|nr:bifunctional glutamate N-acetyltransferase/amino-acid acetyltransferase ArgJ [Deltaproteobacteria bacterium]